MSESNINFLSASTSIRKNILVKLLYVMIVNEQWLVFLYIMYKSESPDVTQSEYKFTSVDFPR